MSNSESHIRLRDRWWLMNYTWHRWRMMRNARASATHAVILNRHYGVDVDQLNIKVKL